VSESRGHPFPRAEETLEQARNVEVGIQAGKLNPETRGCDLDFFQLRCLGVFQALRVARRKTYRQPRIEMDYEPANRRAKLMQDALPRTVSGFYEKAQDVNRGLRGFWASIVCLRFIAESSCADGRGLTLTGSSHVCIIRC